jgi:hypothetical protein
MPAGNTPLLPLKKGFAVFHVDTEQGTFLHTDLAANTFFPVNNNHTMSPLQRK